MTGDTPAAATSKSLPDSVVRAAIHWQLRLETANDSQLVRHQILAWCRRAPENALAWQQLGTLQQEVSASLDALGQPELALPVLQRAGTDLQRRRTLKLLAATLMLAGPAGYTVHQHSPWRSDFTTGTGERRTLELADGSRVMLNTNSALDVAFDTDWRQLTLHRGEVMVDTLGATSDPRPLRLSCDFGHCQTRGSRFVVRQHEHYAQVVVEQGRLQLLGMSGRGQEAGAGESWRLDQHGVSRTGNGALEPAAWTRGMLVVDDIRLAEFAAELARYRHGYLGVDQQVANLRLSGVFQLDDPDALLADLPLVLPIEVRSRTRWWTTLTARG